MKTFLRWLAVLPGAILAAVLVGFPLHFVLYWTLTNPDSVIYFETYPELPERILFPLAATIAFQWAGVNIAPSHKGKTAIILFAVLLVFWIAAVWLVLSGARLGDMHFVAQGGGLAPVFAFIGLFAGLYINWKTQAKASGFDFQL